MTAAGPPQRARAVGDEGSRSARHNTDVDANNGAQIVAGHWPTEPPLLRLRPHPTHGLYIAGDIRRHDYHLHRQLALLPGGGWRSVVQGHPQLLLLLLPSLLAHEHEATRQLPQRPSRDVILYVIGAARARSRRLGRDERR